MSCADLPDGSQVACHNECTSGSNIFMRKWKAMPKGHVIRGHKHNFAHDTIVFTGAVRVKWQGPDGSGTSEFRAPDSFLVKPEVEHEITALEEGTEIWCCYAHRTPQGEIVQEYTGWGPAYG